MDRFWNKVKAALRYATSRKMKRLYRIEFVAVIFILLTTSSAVPVDDNIQLVRKYTRSIEFDYATWIWHAALRKNQQAAFGAASYITDDVRHALVGDCIEITRRINEREAQLETIYSDPEDPNPDNTAQPVKDDLNELLELDAIASPVCESILQQQVSELLAENGLTAIGQPVPPVLFHATPLPVALIISPREVIQQDANISLVTTLTLEEIIALETAIESDLNVSALVQPIGGVGAYPTMIKKTTNLPWYIEVIAHEWAHNFLTLRPLGINYNTTPELRTMNETAANIVGKEISETVLARYYPEYLPEEVPAQQPQEDNLEIPLDPDPREEPVFDFRAEMRETRVTTDLLLAEGKIDEAEAYMETRRQFLWENGYQIRRLNQAYFAFHGAYADQPGGAAGEDPVGPAVRTLREQSPSLASFLRRIGKMNSYEDLLKAIE